MTAAPIFISTFILVFALGFQSLNVNNGHYKMAFITSVAIGGSNLILLKTVPQADLLEILAYLTSGPFAIVASMWAHSKFVKKAKSQWEILDFSEARVGVDMAIEPDRTEYWMINSVGKTLKRAPKLTQPDKNGSVHFYNPIPQPGAERRDRTKK